MKFRTEINIEKGTPLYYPNGILCIGSCFAEHVGKKFQEGKFPCIVNPFGILYNPVSISQGLEMLLGNSLFEENELFSHNDLWHSWMHHGQFSNEDKSKALEGMNRELEEARTFLASAKMLVITLGSANVYVKKDTGKIVANCHKVPGKEFIRRRLDITEIEEVLAEAFKAAQAKYPGLTVVLTVSPVRHIRDGLEDNQRSKASLLLATEGIVKSGLAEYFPSYEIMMDELRGYRFYKADMIHPSDVAVDYIWQKFRDAHFGDGTDLKYRQVMKIVWGFQHRVLHPGTFSHRAFLDVQIRRAERLMEQLPVDFSGEINAFKEELGDWP
jgi:hypothetical protein